MVKSFLEGRKMVMKLGKLSSNNIDTLHGNPQGITLGGILHCATTQKLVGPPLVPPLLDEYVGEESMDVDVDDEEAMTLSPNTDNTTLVLAVSL